MIKLELLKNAIESIDNDNTTTTEQKYYIIRYIIRNINIIDLSVTHLDEIKKDLHIK